VLNIADDEPASRDEVMQYAAQLRGVDLPQKLSPPVDAASGGPDTNTDAGQGLRRSARGEKRVSNRAAKQELTWTLQFPTYREGLLDCLQHDPSLASVP
jgi:hypothetical protein